MSTAYDKSLKDLTACGCGKGTGAQTPQEIENRPGLPAISFRAGTHPYFKASLLAALTDERRPALARLKTRDDDDFTIALLDGAATMADVLTFYSERIAHEAFLRTATEPRSVLELARAIGYELSPGVAASTWVAFTLEPPSPAVPEFVIIPYGTRLQSVPLKDEKPQVFETDAEIPARAAWNRLLARSHTWQILTKDTDTLWLDGNATNLRRGDPLLILAHDDGKPNVSKWDLCKVLSTTVTPGPNNSIRTVVKLESPVKNTAGLRANVYALRTKAGFFGWNAPPWPSMAPEFRRAYAVSIYGIPGTPEQEEKIIQAVAAKEWPEFSFPDGDTLHTDTPQPGFTAGSWLVLTAPDKKEKEKEKAVYHKMLYAVVGNEDDSQSKWSLNSKCSRIRVEPKGKLEPFTDEIRTTTLLGQSELLPWAPAPMLNTISGKELLLDRVVEGLAAGQRLILQGKDATFGGEMTEFCVIESVTVAGDKDPEMGAVKVAEATEPFSKITLTKELKGTYKADRITIWGNVAPVSHGETSAEILGHGNAAAPHQKFVLKQPPLTFIPADNASGGETTLKVWVNDIRWHEVPSLFGHGPEERIYVTRQNDDGGTEITFGDGRQGARLPTGRENVRAIYRKGVGLGGLVKAGQIMLLMTRPVGVREVVNPRATEGAADPQRLDAARRNAPLTVLTLDRAVSLADYEDFARGFSGIAKAHAVWVWSAPLRGVFLTVASSSGEPLAGDSKTLTDFLAALQSLGHPLVSVKAKTFVNVTFKLAGTVWTNPDYVLKNVRDSVFHALRSAFGFAARSFGQPVPRSEVLAVIQTVPGVDSVDLDALYRGPQSSLEAVLTAAKASDGAAATEVEPAELLTLDESSLTNLTFQPS